MTQQQLLEILNEIKVKMYYDTSITLNENIQKQTAKVKVELPDYQDYSSKKIEEQNLLGGDTRIEDPVLPPKDPLQQAIEDMNIFPIPGYTPFITPKIGKEGGYGWMYIPNNATNLKKFVFVNCADFGNGRWCDWEGEDVSTNFFKGTLDINEKLTQIYPQGSLRQFSVGDITYNICAERKDAAIYNLGFFEHGSKCSRPYVSPDPEDYKNAFEKFLDEHEMLYQVVGSIIIILGIEFFGAKLSISVGWRILLEILGELGLNIPVIQYDLKKGNEAQASLNLVFCLLPLIRPGMSSSTKKAAREIGEKLGKKSITTSEELVEFYAKELTTEEQYIFSRVLQQNPEVLAKQMDETLKTLLQQAAKNPDIIRPILFRHKNWWKEAGAQGFAAFGLSILKELYFPDFSDDEKKRMTEFLMEIEQEMDDYKKDEFVEKLITDSTFATNFTNAVLLPTGEDSIKFMNDFLGSLDISSQDSSVYDAEDLSNSPKN